MQNNIYSFKMKPPEELSLLLLLSKYQLSSLSGQIISLHVFLSGFIQLYKAYTGNNLQIITRSFAKTEYWSILGVCCYDV